MPYLAFNPLQYVLPQRPIDLRLLWPQYCPLNGMETDQIYKKLEAAESEEDFAKGPPSQYSFF